MRWEKKNTTVEFERSHKSQSGKEEIGAGKVKCKVRDKNNPVYSFIYYVYWVSATIEEERAIRDCACVHTRACACMCVSQWVRVLVVKTR